MNVRTALISSALLLAVLGWACEQQGPTSPSALGTPGGVTVDAAGGVILGVKPNCEAGPPCKDEDPPEDDPQLFDITITSFDIPAAVQRTSGPGDIFDNDFALNLNFFNDLANGPAGDCALGEKQGFLRLTRVTQVGLMCTSFSRSCTVRTESKASTRLKWTESP